MVLLLQRQRENRTQSELGCVGEVECGHCLLHSDGVVVRTERERCTGIDLCGGEHLQTYLHLSTDRVQQWIIFSFGDAERVHCDRPDAIWTPEEEHGRQLERRH